MGELKMPELLIQGRDEKMSLRLPRALKRQLQAEAKAKLGSTRKVTDYVLMLLLDRNTKR